MPDTRIAYGARCTWWNGIAHVALTTPSASGHRLPCCPGCGGMLFEVESEEKWFEGVDRHDTAGHPGYRAMVEWGRGQCFPNYGALQLAYVASHSGEGASSDGDPDEAARRHAEGSEAAS